MNLQSTDYFIALARERSFTRAAEALHITQQSLSAHIAALEEEFGTPLVVRRVPLELTYAGRVFLRHAERIQRDCAELRQELWDAAGAARGEVRVGIAFGRGRVLLLGHAAARTAHGAGAGGYAGAAPAGRDG